MQTNRYAIGVDVGGSHISCKVFDLNNNRLISDVERSLPIDNKASREKVLSTFEDLLEPSISSIKKEELIGVGLAFPGPFDYANGIGLFSGDNAKYLSLYKINIREELSIRLGINSSAIRFINDATAFAIGEYFNGELQRVEKALAITLGTGFGAAFLEQGVPVIEDVRVPREGCLWYLAFDETIADDYFSTRGLERRFNAFSNIKIQGVKELAKLCKTDTNAHAVFEDFGTKLGVFLTPWLQSFEVDTIVIGGNISRAFALFETPLKQSIKDARLDIIIKPSQHLEDSAFVGAAALLNDEFYTTIKAQLKQM